MKGVKLNISGPYYFAYGSNLHPTRLFDRAPSTRFVNVGILRNYRLAFHKISKDGSGKCDAVLTSNASDQVHGAIFSIDAADVPKLDKKERCGYGYEKANLTVAAGQTTAEVWSYLAQPSHVDSNLWPYDWYKEMVLRGAIFHDFPEAYLDSIRSVPSKTDPDPERRKLKWGAAEKLKR
jgi:gamma-glutamylcyclotransferase